MSIEHLSARCPMCGDRASMPPASEPRIAANDWHLPDRSSDDRLYAVLHLCTNAKCQGATIGYYTFIRDSFRYAYHTPQFEEHVVPEDVPPRPRQLLQDANDARKAATACSQAAVKSVEAMLANKGIVKPGGVKGRIKKAVAEGKLPQLMADWAEEIRQIANDAHTDEVEDPDDLPTPEEAERALMFANTLAEYLYVLPARVIRARKAKD